MLEMFKRFVPALLISGAAYAQAPGPESAEAPLTPEQNLAKATELIEKQNDFLSAMRFLRLAADAGNVRAQTMLGELLDYGEENAEAEKYLALAVAQGDPQAKMGLATMHLAGDAARSEMGEARRLIEEAANQAFAPAVKVLGAAYAKGGLGFTQPELDSPQALSWIRRASDLDDVVALEALEQAYRGGRYGLAPDPAKADELRKRINELTGVKEKSESGRRRRR